MSYVNALGGTRARQPASSTSSPARDRRPRHAAPPEERIGVQLLATTPLLALAVGLEFGTIDGLRRPCTGGFRCLGSALGNRAGVVVLPLSFAVLSAVVLVLISPETASATVLGLVVGAAAGALVVAGAYVLDPIDRGAFDTDRDSAFVAAMAVGGALLIAGGILGGSLAHGSARRAQRRAHFEPLLLVDHAGVVVGGSARF